MNTPTHDPYLDTIRRSREDKYLKYLKERSRERLKKDESSKRSFFKQEVRLTDYINLSEDFANILIFTLVLIIPYSVGIIFIFLIIAKFNIETFEGINISNPVIYWTIGYEIVAFLILILIIKSSISFRKSK